VLGSGSKGNSIAFWDAETAFLIDAGFSCREVARRLGAVGVDAAEVEAIFVSHEHVDHVRGARVFNKRFGAQVRCTRPVGRHLDEQLGVPLGPVIAPGRTYLLGEFTIAPFEVPHDASQTVGFVVRRGKRKVAVATDVGHVSESLQAEFRGSDAIVLEFNHDVRMLKHGPYPAFLKQRILGKNGHLSNADAAGTLAAAISKNTRHVTLAHLSQENNTPEIALDEAVRALKRLKGKRPAVVPASQSEAGEVVDIK